MTDNFLHDLRYALRILRKAPGFTAVAVGTLALAIGASSSIFSVVNAVLLRELPYREADRLVILWGADRKADNLRSQVTFPDVVDWRRAARSFEEITAFHGWDPILSGEFEPERLGGIQVSDGYFTVMKTAPLLGRVFTPEEQQEGKDRVVVLSYGFWQRKFSKDPGLVGRSIRLNGVPHTVVGVMPPEFRSLPASLIDQPAEIYRPLAEPYSERERSGHHDRAIARLKPGVTLETAQAEMNVVASRLEREHRETNAGLGVHIVPLKVDIVRNIRPALVILQFSVLLLVLIACANIANLLLARSTVRRKEIAIRTALGAGRGRLIRQVLTESVVLGALGGALGILLTVWSMAGLAALGAKALPELAQIDVDLRVLLFTAAVSIVTGIVFGIAPAMQASATGLSAALKEGGRSSRAAGRAGFRNLLVVAQTALALVLLVSAGLLIKSFMRLRGVDPGFDARGTLVASVGIPEFKYSTAQKRIAFFRELMERVKRVPGVEHAAAVDILPESGNFNQMLLDIPGRVYAAGEAPGVDQYIVTADFFRTIGIPLVRGRLLTAEDDENHSRVCLINETAARRLWPNQYPLGVKVRTGGDGEPWRTIVGIVGDTYHYGLDSQKTMQLYIPHPQWPNGGLTLLVRTAQRDPMALVPAVRAAVRSIDKDQPVTDAAIMDQILADSMAGRRFSMFLLAVFAFGALLLASIGLYGVISYSVTQRTNEIGIRIALGAGRSDVLRMVFGQGMALVGAGIVAGLIVAAAATGLLSTLLFGVSSTDWTTFAMVSGVLLAVAFVASYVPARRATKVDPMTALRYE